MTIENIAAACEGTFVGGIGTWLRRKLPEQ